MERTAELPTPDRVADVPADVAAILRLDPRPDKRDVLVYVSFSKTADSPRFPTPPFARVILDRK
jgi:hypothetical protein